jgi:hypothetical protein
MRFGFFCDRSSPANMTAQQLFRVRNTTDKNIYLCIEDSFTEYPTKKNDIDKYLNDYINLENNIIDLEINKCIDERFGLLKWDIIERKFKKDMYYNLLVNYIQKLNRSRNNFRTELLCFLYIQGYYIKSNIKCNIDNRFKKLHKFIVKKDIKERIKEDAKLYRETKCPSYREFEKIEKMDKMSHIDKIKFNLYRLKEQKINISNDTDEEIIRKVDNIYNARFDYKLMKENKECLSTKDFILTKLLCRSKNVSLNESDIDGYMFIDDDKDSAFTIYPDDFDETDRFNIHNQQARDYWLKCYHSISLLELLGFKDNFDFDKKISSFDENIRSSIHKHVNDNWKNFKLLYEIKNNMKNKKPYFGSHFIKFINSKLKLINRQIMKIRTGKNKVISYKLIKLIE